MQVAITCMEEFVTLSGSHRGDLFKDSRGGAWYDAILHDVVRGEAAGGERSLTALPCTERSCSSMARRVSHAPFSRASEMTVAIWRSTSARGPSSSISRSASQAG